MGHQEIKKEANLIFISFNLVLNLKSFKISNIYSIFVEIYKIKIII
jgi:hypothetical protein